MEKAVIYCRKSRDDDGNTIEMQRDRLTAYCALHNYEIVEVIEERGVSGTMPLGDRPDGKRVIQLLNNGSCQHIVALKLDRLFRNIVDCSTWTQNWHNQGVSLHLVDMGGTSINSGSSIGNLFITLISAFSTFEVEQLKERTSASLQHKKKNRKVYGVVPYGWDRVGDDLVENTTEQSVIASVRAWRASGDSFQAIATKLNERRITGKSGGKWYPTSISNLLNFVHPA
jgi:DNA invertase Pin-like site-specific DNA recombinase